MAKLNCVTVLAPAKLNLSLDVVGTLPNGYHDLDMVMDLCTRCIVMKDGSILADAPVPDIFADCALLEEARLEQPLSYRLMQYGRERENSGQF